MKRPPDIRSSVAAVIAVFAGVRPGICMIAEPTLIRLVDAASHASTVTGVGAPGLGGPDGVVAELLGVLHERHELRRVRSRRRVAEIDAELHRTILRG